MGDAANAVTKNNSAGTGRHLNNKLIDFILNDLKGQSF